MDLREFYAWEATTRDTIDLKKIYVDIAGDLVAGLLLSQIVFWFLPNKDGESKLRVEKDGKKWLVKRREDWWEEIRITPKQLDRALKLLEDKGLVECRLYRFDGSPQKHISLVIEELLTQLSDRLASIPCPDWIFTKGENPFSPKGKIHFDERVKTLTETTTETTTEKKHMCVYPDEFEEFWKVYPRRIEKKKAFRNWQARIREGYSPSQLIEAAKKYATKCETENTLERYIKHPATFLGPDKPFEEFLKKEEPELDGWLRYIQLQQQALEGDGV